MVGCLRAVDPCHRAHVDWLPALPGRVRAGPGALDERPAAPGLDVLRRDRLHGDWLPAAGGVAGDRVRSSDLDARCLRRLPR